MLICQNAEGVHGLCKVGNPCFRVLEKRTSFTLSEGCC